MDATRKLEKLERHIAREWEESEAASTIFEEDIPVPTSVRAVNYDPSEPLPRSASYSPPKPTQGRPIPVTSSTKYENTHGRNSGRQENGFNASRPRQFIPPTLQTRPSHAHQARIRSANSEPGAQYGRQHQQVKFDLTPQNTAKRGIGFSDGQSLRGPNAIARASRRPPPRIWADPPPLLTNRMADAKQAKNDKQQEDAQYLRRPDPDEEFPAVAYYVWPSNMPDEKPADILGHSLEELNAVRIENKVFVMMNRTDTCIKICSRLAEGADERLQSAIREMRERIRAEQAIRNRARPLRIVMPPTAGAMTTFMKPAIVQRTTRPHTASHLGLGDVLLSDEERLKWENERPELLQKCQQDFEHAMDKGLRQLGPYKGWMQLRLRFGRIELEEPKVRFKNGRSDWIDFSKMMAAERMSSTLKPALDAEVVKLLCQKIINWPETFGPADGRYLDMMAVPFKDTEIIFFHTSAGPYRMEVEIDRIVETEEGEYQVGSTRVFKDNNRNKRLRVTNVNVEKRMDWEIELITDNAIPMDEVPAPMLKMAMSSVTTNTPVVLDSTALEYPLVKPIAPNGAIIDGIVVRTVAEYAVKASGYVIQLAIYRRWTPSNPAVEISAGVTMYHRDWDYSTRDLNGTLEARNWNDPLKLFFGHYADLTNDAVEGSKGVKNFLQDVEYMRDCLVDAVQEIDAIRKQEEAMAAEGEAAEISMEENREDVSGQVQAGQDGDLPNIGGLHLSNNDNQPTQTPPNAGEDFYEDLYSAD